jgi:hypothetical protein
VAIRGMAPAVGGGDDHSRPPPVSAHLLPGALARPDHGFAVFEETLATPAEPPGIEMDLFGRKCSRCGRTRTRRIYEGLPTCESCEALIEAKLRGLARTGGAAPSTARRWRRRSC